MISFKYQVFWVVSLSLINNTVVLEFPGLRPIIGMIILKLLSSELDLKDKNWRTYL